MAGCGICSELGLHRKFTLRKQGQAPVTMRWEMLFIEGIGRGSRYRR
jgi:hypothetical protein